jgi:hypothetical protein
MLAEGAVDEAMLIVDHYGVDKVKVNDIEILFPRLQMTLTLPIST